MKNDNLILFSPDMGENEIPTIEPTIKESENTIEPINVELPVK